LMLSKKAKKVLKTGLNLSNQHSGKEVFWYSRVADMIVKQFSLLLNIVSKICPRNISKFVSSRFKTVKNTKKDRQFDYIRASVILICSSILISIATAYKLPLSTTYVTFMVAICW
jgi:N-acyl-L-homoserine lactone synthetase